MVKIVLPSPRSFTAASLPAVPRKIPVDTHRIFGPYTEIAVGRKKVAQVREIGAPGTPRFDTLEGRWPVWTPWD